MWKLEISLSIRRYMETTMEHTKNRLKKLRTKEKYAS